MLVGDFQVRSFAGILFLGQIAAVAVLGRVISGGQTGADRAALDAARACGVDRGGWAPADGWAEDYPAAPGLLEDYPELRPMPNGPLRARTERNVVDSDATLILWPFPGRRLTRGTALTRQLCRAHGRPCCVADPSAFSALEEVLAWLEGLSCRHAVVLNVAGPRESAAPGSYRLARGFLIQLFERAARPDD